MQTHKTNNIQSLFTIYNDAWGPNSNLLDIMLINDPFDHCFLHWHFSSSTSVINSKDALVHYFLSSVIQAHFDMHRIWHIQPSHCMCVCSITCQQSMKLLLSSWKVDRCGWLNLVCGYFCLMFYNCIIHILVEDSYDLFNVLWICHNSFLMLTLRR